MIRPLTLLLSRRRLRARLAGAVYSHSPGSCVEALDQNWMRIYARVPKAIELRQRLL